MTNVSPTDLRTLFNQHLDTIHTLIGFISRQQHLRVEDAEEFSSLVKLRLMEDDFAVFAKFKGESSMKTYLNSVIYRFYLDFRNQQWGRWRPSTVTRDFGPLAVLLEKLVYKDGYAPSQAFEILRTNFQVNHTFGQLQELFEKLPRHNQTQDLEGLELEEFASSQPGQETLLVEKENLQQRRHLAKALSAAKQRLNEEERYIIHMHFAQELSIATIARSLCCDQRRLYRRVEKILKKLGASLKRQGFKIQQIRNILG